MRCFLVRNKKDFVIIFAVIRFVAISHGFQPLSWARISDETHTSNSNPVNSNTVIVELLEAHNRERAQAGLSPLHLNPRLTQAAQAHAQDMAARGNLSHKGSDGSTPAQRVERQDYPYIQLAENIAAGHQTSDAVVHSWMESPHHRRNILGDFSELGAARVTSEAGVPYWVTVFGQPMQELDPTQATAELVKLLNRERAAANLPPFRVDPKLVDTAQTYASDMATHDTLRRRGGGRITPFERVQQEGDPYSEISQSAASGIMTPQAVVQHLMGNPAHKEMVFGSFSAIGAGYAVAEDGTPYWGLIFALPKGEENRDRG